MTKENFEGYKYIEGGVCAARGFVANGLNCGINPDKNKNDLGVIYSETLCNTAAVYTQNKVKGAPIIVTKKHLDASNGTSKAVIVNSKNANTCNADGEEIAEKVCELAAVSLGIKPEEAIFVDDSESNLEAAEEFGMIPILIDVYNSQGVESKYPIIHSISELIEK